MAKSNRQRQQLAACETCSNSGPWFSAEVVVTVPADANQQKVKHVSGRKTTGCKRNISLTDPAVQ